MKKVGIKIKTFDRIKLGDMGIFRQNSSGIFRKTWLDQPGSYPGAPMAVSKIRQFCSCHPRKPLKSVILGTKYGKFYKISIITRILRHLNQYLEQILHVFGIIYRIL